MEEKTGKTCLLAQQRNEKILGLWPLPVNSRGESGEEEDLGYDEEEEN